MLRNLILSTAALFTGVGFAQAADLSVDVAGVRDAQGKIMVALYAKDGDGKFPDLADALAAQWRKAEPGTLRFVFPGLNPGQYAVSVFHDENGNGELDTNLLGIPSEGYGFSQDAKGTMGPPSFDAAAVELAKDGASSTTATLGY